MATHLSQCSKSKTLTIPNGNEDVEQQKLLLFLVGMQNGHFWRQSLTKQVLSHTNLYSMIPTIWHSRKGKTMGKIKITHHQEQILMYMINFGEKQCLNVDSLIVTNVPWWCGLSIEKKVIHVWGQEIYGNSVSLCFLFSFSVNLKSFLKKKSIFLKE